jgi:sirohydrochlorin cobaltochelatase
MKRVILIVGFGTSHPDARATTIDALASSAARRFPNLELRIAFTSQRVIDRIRKQEGIEIPNVEDALSALSDEGFETVVVQPLHLLNGLEFHKIVQSVGSMKRKGAFEEIGIGRPLLSQPEDYSALIDALKEQFPPLTPEHAVVLMGHGTSHPSNAAYSCLQLMMNDEGLNVLVGTLEGYPGLARVREKLQRSGVKEVTLMPLLLTTGDHTKNDMAGSGSDSWQSVLERDGFTVHPYIHGLGESVHVHSLYVQHIEDALRELTAK